MVRGAVKTFVVIVVVEVIVGRFTLLAISSRVFYHFRKIA